MKSIKIPMAEFCATFQISEGTFRNWRDGKNSPPTRQFERLKALAEGHHVTPTSGGTPEMDKMREEIGALKYRMAQLEGKIDELLKNDHREKTA